MQVCEIDELVCKHENNDKKKLGFTFSMPLYLVS